MSRQINKRVRKNVPRFDETSDQQNIKNLQIQQELEKQNLQQLNEFLQQVRSDSIQNKTKKIENLEGKLNLINQKFKKLNEEDRQIVSVKKQSNEDRQVEISNESYDIENPNDYNEIKQHIRRKKLILELQQENVINEPSETIELQMEQKVLRMMQKQGWSVGKGLGKNKQGMKTPLIMMKTNNSQAVIVEQGEGIRSRVILLKNMVEQEDDYDGLRGEVQAECLKYGDIKDIVIYQEISQTAVKVFVQYENIESAQDAYRQLNNRYFGGRVIVCEYYDEKKFEQKDLTL